EGLGAVRDVSGRRVQDDLAQRLAERGGARLAGEQHLVPALGQPVVQQRRLGGLAGALAAFQRDEAASRRVGARGLAEAATQVTQEWYAGPVVDLAPRDDADD